MIKSVISSAARLPLAPARLTGRISGSLLRQLRGIGGPEAQPASSSRTSGASRRRAKPKRAAAGTRAKAQPKRAAAGTRAKAQPKRAAAGTRAKAQPKRAAAGTRAKAQPKRASRPKPLDDATIARKVESTIFRDLDVDKGEVIVNVDEGVVSLDGEVRTPDLIKELEARATRVTEVRRVENSMRVPERPASARTDMPAPQPETGRFQRQRPGDRAVVSAETSEEAPAPGAADRTEAFAAAGQGRAASPVGSPSGAGEPAAGSPDGDESAEQDEPEVAELDKDPAYQPSDPSLRGLKGG
jgi:hypothetical protein